MALVTRHYVMRQYSGPTRNKVLWQVMTRGIKDERDAANWLDYLSVENPKHELFIVTRTEEED